MMNLVPIIPVEVKQIRDGDNIINPLVAKRTQLINGVRRAFNLGEIIDMNDCSSAAHIKSQVLTYTDSQFKIANVKRIHASYKSAPDNILKSIQKRIPLKLGSSCGIKADGSELTIFVFHEDFEGIAAGTVFLDSRVPGECQEQASPIANRQLRAVLCDSHLPMA